MHNIKHSIEITKHTHTHGKWGLSSSETILNITRPRDGLGNGIDKALK